MYNFNNKYKLNKDRIDFLELYTVLNISDINEDYSNFLVNLSKNSTGTNLLNINSFNAVGIHSKDEITFLIKGHILTELLEDAEINSILTFVDSSKKHNFSQYIIKK